MYKRTKDTSYKPQELRKEEEKPLEKDFLTAWKKAA